VGSAVIGWAFVAREPKWDEADRNSKGGVACQRIVCRETARQPQRNVLDCCC
jgi:hypothetical protein